VARGAHSPFDRLSLGAAGAGLLVAIALCVLPERAAGLTVAGFGDSLSWAPGYLAQLPAEWETVNLSQGGEVSWDGLVRLQSLLPTLDADVVVLMEGSNDVRHVEYTLDRSVDSLAAMMDAVLAEGISVVLMAPPPLLPWGPSPAADTENGRLLALADALEPLAAARGIPFVDLLPIFAGLDSLDDYYWDLVHPNALGSGVIAGAVAPAIEAAAVVPEPSTALLLGAGLLAVAARRGGLRRSRSARESA
jgi:lysophospholipase L1-like esterase